MPGAESWQAENYMLVFLCICDKLGGLADRWRNEVGKNESGYR